MKILSYNIREGLLANWDAVQDGAAPAIDADRWRLLLDVLAGAGADIVALQELTTWSPHRLARLAADAGYPHHALAHANTRHHLGLLSRMPLTGVWRSHSDLWHATLVAEAGGVRVQVVHLCPVDGARRAAEVPVLLRAGADLLVGDFNAPPGAGDAADAVIAAGHTDVLGERDPRPTRPTPAYSGRPVQRLDLALARPEVAARVCNATRIDMPETDVLSDHYPIQVVLDGHASP